MFATDLKITSFDPRGTTEKEYAGRNAFLNRSRAERFGEETPVPLDEEVRGWQAMPAPIVGRWWNVWRADEREVVAVAHASYLRAEDNQHMANCDIAVAPAFRRQGIATRLLPLVAQLAQDEGKRLLMAWTSSLIPAGEAFMRRIGGELGQAMHTNELDLATLDRALIRRWVAQGEQNRDFTLGVWTGPFPEADIETICQLLDVMNTMPRDKLDVEDWHTLPEQMRQWEALMRARGDERWVMYARHTPSGELAGFTELFWNPNRPHKVEQGGTGVWPYYRNHGLGRWLKAAMIEKLMSERPEVRRVRTGNAHSNAPMLKINFEMGFKPSHSELRWQVPTSQVLTYLAQHEPLLATRM